MSAPPRHALPGGLKLYSRLLLGISAGMVGAAYALAGIDLAGAVLLGSVVVGTNYMWSKRVYSRLLLKGEGGRGRLAVLMLCKLGLTGWILYAALVLWKMNPLGILLGVSTIFITVLLFAPVKTLAKAFAKSELGLADGKKNF